MTSLTKISNSSTVEGVDIQRIKIISETQRINEKNESPKEELDHKKIVEDVNNKLSMIGTKVALFYDMEMGKEIIKVIDAKTNEVIRQIPSEEILRVSRQIDYLIGVFYDAAK